MKYQLLYGEYASNKELRKLNPAILLKIKRQIEKKLTTNPEVFGKPLRKSLKGYRRLRVDNWRVIFKLEGVLVKIIYIGKKPDVYEHFERKLL